MTSHRTQSLIDRVPAHPRAAVIKNAMIEALTASEAFVARNVAMKKAGTLTALGQRQALRDELTGNYGKAVARAAEPIRKARQEIADRRSKLSIKAIDPTNIAAALERQEIRSWLRSLPLNDRQSALMNTKNLRILEAAVTAPPELSGILELGQAAEQVAGEIEVRYLKMEHGAELSELEALEAVVAEGEAAAAIARNELMLEMEIEPRLFDQLMQPIEQGVGRPWLIKNGDAVTVATIDDNGAASYRPASADDLANGIYYADFNAYKQAQGIAA